jgi:hypothetical protein
VIPTQKVTSAGAAGAFVTIVVWLVGAVTSVEVPGEVAAALTTIVAFAAGYLVRETRPVDPPA